MNDLKKDIFKDVKRIQEEMDLLFNHFCRIRNSPVLTTSRLWRPPTDVFESGNEVIILLEIGGMRQKDFSITFADNVLTVKGERKEKFPNPKTYYINMEINYGGFERNIYLPENINKDNIRANYRNGYLEIRMNKIKAKKLQKKEIKIK